LEIESKILIINAASQAGPFMQIENKESFIPEHPIIAIVGVISPQILGHKTIEESNHSLYELKQLLRTLHLTSIKEYVQSIKKIDPGHVIGEGKIQEIQKDIETIGFNLLVFDIELSASQHRNIQQTTGLTVVDRNMIILEIFARHARSKDAKMQIEIAKLEYVLPRIHSVWYHQDRGTGGGPGMRSGQGETAKELEKRAIKERIAHYKKESGAIETNLTEQRKKRDENTYLAALVGYTNAGKSSLMNRLCHEEVLEEDKLFATVDAVYRSLSVHFKPPILLIDTVGFISNLPTQLVKGFRTTLASVKEAHYLIIVSDISHIHCKEQLLVTLEVLKDLKVDRPSIIVFNKKDKMHENERAKDILKEFPNHLLVSSFDENDVEQIKQHVVNYFHSVQTTYHLMIPYADGYAHAKIMELGNIINSENCVDGIKYHVTVNPSLVNSEIVVKYKMGIN